MEEILTGKVEKYFGKIGVAAIRITAGELKQETQSRSRAIRPTSSKQSTPCRWSTRRSKKPSSAMRSGSR